MISLPKHIMTIVSEELDHAFYVAGRRILSLYLDELGGINRLAKLKSDDHIRALLDEAMKDAGLARRIDETRKKAHERTQNILCLLEGKLRSQSPPIGLKFAEARLLIRKDLGHKISDNGLIALLRRNINLHSMTVRSGSVRLNSDIIVSMISEHYQKKNDEVTMKMVGRSRRGKR